MDCLGEFARRRAADLLALASQIVAGVQAAYGVTLTPEPILVGVTL